jgi:hypothetical protein
MTKPFFTNKPKFVIQVVRPSRPSAAQTVIDREHSIRRRRAVGRAYEQMCALLTHLTGGRLTRCALMRLAEELATTRGIRIDRTAKRMKDCLICWFCENWVRLSQPQPLKDTMWIDDGDSPNVSFDLEDADEFAGMEWD